MQEIPSNTEARTRVLDVAEKLFTQRGYTAVTLRDIASEVGIRHASLYHHIPGGKEELYVEVTERHLRRQQVGLAQTIAHAEPTIRAQLFAIAHWLLSQPPMDLVRMQHSDMPAIAPKHAQHLSTMMLSSLILPIADVLQQAQQRGEIAHHDLGLVAGGLFGMIESLFSVPDTALVQSRTKMAHELIDVLLNGLCSHETSSTIS